MTKRRPDQFERQPRGFYPTPVMAVLPVLRHIIGSVWEPCAGAGHMCDILADNGFDIAAATDIAPRHDFVAPLDALAITADMVDASRADAFVTNPPWPEPRSRGEPTMAILTHLASLLPTWLLLPADFMHNDYASEAMGYCTTIVSVGRVKWIPGTKKAGFDNVCWYRFRYPPCGRSSPQLTFWPRGST